MGLGPPVCQHCQVIGVLVSPPRPIVRTEQTTTFNKVTSWVCPVCGNTDLQGFAGFGSFKKYEDNLKFLKFMLNK